MTKKPSVGQSLLLNARAFTITGVDAKANRVDYEESPVPHDRQPSKGVLAFDELEWVDTSWGLPGREHKKVDTGGAKLVIGPPSAGPVAKAATPVKPRKSRAAAKQKSATKHAGKARKR